MKVPSIQFDSSTMKTFSTSKISTNTNRFNYIINYANKVCAKKC